VTHDFSPGALIVGTRYRVVRPIGEGGMGWLFDVEHVELGKRFVLKVLRPECARRSDLVARLRNEWRALGRLQHPNIVAATDAGDTADQIPFFVMERLEGEPLSRRLRREGRLSIPVALEIAACILEGLAAAHEIGIVHRDIKPPNVFLVRGGGVKLLDFGVAKFDNPAAQVVTAHGVAIGTPRYMSPEQANGAKVDGRADLYATGLILFELVTGQSPFEDARDTTDLIVAHLAREAPRLASLLPGVSPELDRIVAGLLAKDPRARPSNARELAAALRAIGARARCGVSTNASTVQAHYSASTVCGQAAADPGLHPLAHRAVAGASSFADATPGYAQSWVDAPTLPDDALQDATTRPLARRTESDGRAGWAMQAGTQSCTTPESDRARPEHAHPSPQRGSQTDQDAGALPAGADGLLGAQDTSRSTLRLFEPSASAAVADAELAATHTAVPRGAHSLSETPPPVTPSALVAANQGGHRLRASGRVVGAVVGAAAVVALGLWGALASRSVPGHDGVSASGDLEGANNSTSIAGQVTPRLGARPAAASQSADELRSGRDGRSRAGQAAQSRPAQASGESQTAHARSSRPPEATGSGPAARGAGAHGSAALACFARAGRPSAGASPYFRGTFEAPAATARVWAVSWTAAPALAG
jgi:hypothetical protein